MNNSVRTVEGPGVVVQGNDIDTDRIIPARFMKCVTFVGLGVHAFHDERFDSSGASRNHPFDDERWAAHPVLISNANFGCGSSREHAPQALKDYGIRAVIAESFAEIFAGNCSALGIPAMTMDDDNLTELQNLVRDEPQTELVVDVENGMVRAGDKSWDAAMPEAYRKALLDGSWDSTAVLSQSGEAIDQVAANLPYVV